MIVVRAYSSLLANYQAVAGDNNEDRDGKPIILLRHDVDHDLNAALRIASLEAARGVQASFFLLPTAPYWLMSYRDAAARELESLGHTVGIHNNALAQWAKGEVDNPYDALKQQVKSLRAANVSVGEASSHGDRICYEVGFNNSWLFDFCWSGNSLREEWEGLSAEGVPDRRPEFTVPTPSNKTLTRSDGKTIELGLASLADYQLTSDVTHRPGAVHVSDSGGNWRRGGPNLLNKIEGPATLLVHPEYWTSEHPSLRLVMACARSGTKWLQKILENHAEARVTHEHILNNLGSRSKTEHMTSAGVADFPLESLIEPALASARSEFSNMEGSWIEINVYLAPYLDLLEGELPSSEKIALFRNPRAVVASLLKRHWFDTTVDVHHVRPLVDGWESLNQFERVCHYVAHTNAALLNHCTASLRLEDLVESPERFQVSLAKVGIICELPSQEELAGRVDASPPRSNFTAVEEKSFERILGDTCSRLGYHLGGERSGLLPLPRRSDPDSNRFVRSTAQSFFDAVIERATVMNVDLNHATRVGLKRSGNISTRLKKRRIPLRRLSWMRRFLSLVERRRIHLNRHIHLVLGGSSWDKSDQDEGWDISPESEYIVKLNSRFESEEPVTLMLLEYNDNVRTSPPRRILRLRGGDQSVMFRCQEETGRFDLAVYGSAGIQFLAVEQFSLWRYEKDFTPRAIELLNP